MGRIFFLFPSWEFLFILQSYHFYWILRLRHIAPENRGHQLSQEKQKNQVAASEANIEFQNSFLNLWQSHVQKEENKVSWALEGKEHSFYMIEPNV